MSRMSEEEMAERVKQATIAKTIQEVVNIGFDMALALAKLYKDVDEARKDFGLIA